MDGPYDAEILQRLTEILGATHLVIDWLRCIFVGQCAVLFFGILGALTRWRQ